MQLAIMIAEYMAADGRPITEDNRRHAADRCRKLSAGKVVARTAADCAAIHAASEWRKRNAT